MTKSHHIEHGELSRSAHACRDKRLSLIMTDRAHEIRVPLSVIMSARRKLQTLQSVADERTLRNWKSLHFEKLSGNRGVSAEMAKALGAAFDVPAEIRHVPRLLQECGVRFAIVEKLPGGKIDGVCFWFDKSSPVIGMSLLRDRIDNFWFVVMHEIEHVLLKHGQKNEIIDIDLMSLQDTHSEEERLANEAGAEFCVSQKKWIRSMLEKLPLYLKKMS